MLASHLGAAAWGSTREARVLQVAMLASRLGADAWGSAREARVLQVAMLVTKSQVGACGAVGLLAQLPAARGGYPPAELSAAVVLAVGVQ